jgi:hypothetical protein
MVNGNCAVTLSEENWLLKEKLMLLVVNAVLFIYSTLSCNSFIHPSDEPFRVYCC